MPHAEPRCVVVVPNMNGLPHLLECLESLQAQTIPLTIVVVDNASTDGSVEAVTKHFPRLAIIVRRKNYGFTGGVNPGMQWAIDNGYPYVALLNNDAVASKDWAKQLVSHMDDHPKAGIATSKITDMKGVHLDSTGEFYTSWGLPYARGRGEADSGQYDKLTAICAASGGASIYRVAMLKKIGLFDQDFFAYYEDVDISLRAQLNGWLIHYVPAATVRHRIGVTSSRFRGFTTYQTVKNLPWVAIKNIPAPLLITVLPRLWFAHTAFFWKGIFAHRNISAALRGLVMCYTLIPKKLWQRHTIQRQATSPDRIKKIIQFDLPPDAISLRRLRSKWRKVLGRGE